MHDLRTTLCLLPALLLAVTLLGCDSGGDNGGDPLSGNLTYEVEGPEGTSVGVSEEYFWTGDNRCFANRSTNASVPLDDDLGVSEVSTCENIDVDNFDGVRVTVTPTSGDAGLTLKVLSDGDVVEETSETTEIQGGLEVYRVSVGETFELTDF